MKFYQGKGLNGDMPRSLTSPLYLESWVSNSTMSDISLPFQAWKNFASALVTKDYTLVTKNKGRHNIIIIMSKACKKRL